ncbi:M23 family metallopeptidase [Promicromonospora thailandica]|uniref:Peptidase family M23 n=1 Tax=Promicromonospora thailandica TaxID=765201 RepID=A0A9X2G6W6_9MICO|nr:M23 family metallopeptidase [Promicromonospora thailandica]MCP2266683.1 Peptidase family M23 [Promicromonospora thailandica]
MSGISPIHSSPTRRRTARRLMARHWALAALAAFTLAATPAATATASVVAPDAVVPLATAHRSPFSCGKTFYANNWSGGHNPSGSIDWQSYDGDAVGGENVRATAAGTATFDDEGSTSYGKWVQIVHSDGTRTRYAHLATMVRAPGQTMSVSRGTVIGTVGSTGGSSAPHLHYEQRSSSGVVDTSPTVDGVTVSLGQKKAVTSTNGCGGSSNPYTPQEVCGSAFSVIDSAALGSVGRTYLLYNASNGNNCVVTLKSTNLGTPTAVSAFLEPQGASRTTDSGNFSYYAGPVKRSAPGTCVKWGGSVGGTAYTSPFEHCG